MFIFKYSSTLKKNRKIAGFSVILLNKAYSLRKASIGESFEAMRAG